MASSPWQVRTATTAEAATSPVQSTPAGTGEHGLRCAPPKALAVVTQVPTGNVNDHQASVNGSPSRAARTVTATELVST